MPSSRCQSTDDAGLLGGVQQLALDPLARRGRGRAQPERRAAADLVERERVAQPPARHDVAQRERAEVVGRAGVDALLGAGGDEPDRARRIERVQARREPGQQPEARGVVLRARRGRHGVGVGHQHAQAATALAHADHVARAPARRVEPLHAHVQPRALEALPHPRVRAPLEPPRRRPRAVARDRDRHVVRLHSDSRRDQRDRQQLRRRRAG